MVKKGLDAYEFSRLFRRSQEFHSESPDHQHLLGLRLMVKKGLDAYIKRQKDDIRNVQKQSEPGIGRETFQHA
jgi:hypothetical protein